MSDVKALHPCVHVTSWQFIRSSVVNGLKLDHWRRSLFLFVNHDVCFSVSRKTHLIPNLYLLPSSFPQLFPVYSLHLPSALQLFIPFRSSSSRHLKLFFTYLFEEEDWHQLLLLLLSYLIYPAFPCIIHSLQFHLSLHTSCSCLPSIPPSVSFSHFPPSLPSAPHLASISPQTFCQYCARSSPPSVIPLDG